VLNFSPEKVVLLMVIALVVLGPHRLPAAAKSLGKMIGQLRQMSGSLQSELAEPKKALMGTINDFGLNELRDSVRGLNPLSGPLPPRPSAPVPNTPNPGAADPGAPGAAGAAFVSPPSNGSVDLPPAPDDPSLN
jgi:sec-independent protein translocase protein TatB